MTKRAMNLGLALVLAVSANGMQAASAKTKLALSETDTYALEMAESACASQDFSALFEAMARSDMVRAKYSAPTINVVIDGATKSVAADNYADFPIALLDYSWVTRASVLASEADPATVIENVEKELNQSKANQWAVEWQVVRYGPPSEDNEIGEIIERIGKPGVLSFEPYDGCWRLIEDFRG